MIAEFNEFGNTTQVEPREVVEHLLQLMCAYAQANHNVPEAISPFAAMLGQGKLIDPSDDASLREIGVGSVTPWIEHLGRLGLVGNVAPRVTGWIGFAPSRRFYEMIERGQDAAVADALSAAFPVPQPTATPVSVAVSSLLNELATRTILPDRQLVTVVLHELRDVCMMGCRHAEIVLCAKLLELTLGATLVRWGRDVPKDATLGTLIDGIRGCAAERAPAGVIRDEAQSIVALGIPGISDLIRTVRNGAVHAQAPLNGRPVEIPTIEQANAVVLLTVDIMRRFLFAPIPP